MYLRHSCYLRLFNHFGELHQSVVVVGLLLMMQISKLFHWKATPTRAFNEFFKFGIFVKIREFFCRGNEFSIYALHLWSLLGIISPVPVLMGEEIKSEARSIIRSYGSRVRDRWTYRQNGHSVMHCNIVRDVLKTAIRHNAGI